MTCHHQGTLPFDRLCKQQHANDECFGLVSDKADGQAAIAWTAAWPHPFHGTRILSEKGSNDGVCTHTHISSPTAILCSSLPAGNAIHFVARGQLDFFP
jgi:hypothetical protein